MNHIYFQELSKEQQLSLLKWILINDQPKFQYTNHYIYHKGWKEFIGKKISYKHKFKVHQDYKGDLFIKEPYRSDFAKFISDIKPPNNFPHYLITNFPFYDIFIQAPDPTRTEFILPYIKYNKQDIENISNFINESIDEYVVKFKNHKILRFTYNLSVKKIQNIVCNMQILHNDILNITIQYLMIK